jgi:hypothetical protein
MVIYNYIYEERPCLSSKKYLVKRGMAFGKGADESAKRRNKMNRELLIVYTMRGRSLTVIHRESAAR